MRHNYIERMHDNMHNKQIISQLKGLRKVKPAKDWALLVKNDLLAEPVWQEAKRTEEPIFAFFARPVFAISSALVVGFAILGTLAYFGLQKSTYDLQAFIDKISFQTEESKKAVASLKDVQSKMDEVKSALLALKNTKDPKSALTVAEIIKATAKNSEKAIENIQSSNGTLSKQVSASLDTIKSFSQELQKTSADLQVEMFKTYLQDLKTRTLSADDQERLKKAEAYFKDGKIDEAIILLMKIGENSSQ